MLPASPPPETTPPDLIDFAKAWTRGWTRWEWDGRTSRREYRLRTVSWMLEYAAIFVLAVVAGAAKAFGAPWVWPCVKGVWIAWELAQRLQRIGLTVRRLHDAGQSGWWWFLHSIPVVGGLVLLVVLLCLPGQRGTNFYGPDPTLPKTRLRTPMDL